MADLVLRGGWVVDGTGADRVRADVAVTDGRISAIGADLGTELEGAETIDVTGLVVAPGFIDIHTHYDAQVFWDPALTPSCYHGVTTVVAGNCGFTIAPTRPDGRELIARTLENVEDMDYDVLAAGIPWDFETFPEYLDSIERRGVGLNWAAYVGHTSIRLFVMGAEAYERLATPAEITEMQQVLRDALAAGAAGFATSFGIPHNGMDGKPVPSRHAGPAEVEALVDVLAETRRGVLGIVPGGDFPPTTFADLQRRAGVPLTWGALLTSPAGTHDQQLANNEAAWASGAQVWPQVTPRPLTFMYSLADPYPLNMNPRFAALHGRPVDQRAAAYADPAWRAEVAEIWANQGHNFGIRWDTYTIGECPTRPELVGRRLADLAAERGVHPFDALLDIALEEPGLLLRVRVVLANDDTDAVARLLREEHTTLGLSDAGAHAGQLCDASQATDLLGNWVRDRGALTLEAAVRKLSGLQADIFGFADRGYLRVGAAADIAVFDAATVAPGPVRRVNDFPGGSARLTADQPVGVRHVLVNGVAIVRDGEHTGVRDAGQIVRPVARG